MNLPKRFWWKVMLTIFLVAGLLTAIVLTPGYLKARELADGEMSDSDRTWNSAVASIVIDTNQSGLQPYWTFRYRDKNGEKSLRIYVNNEEETVFAYDGLPPQVLYGLLP